ncbi:type I DNA topoisomerase [Deltaproteobacteria bacterium]|nr:type I DNA topoisomerase [Deltaproteobacteria bacterium]
MEKKKQTPRRKRSGAAPDTTGKQLVIVESPAKARTINKYLGPDYIVMASVGHVRDLPGKNPKGVKDPVPGVDLDNDFSPTYQIIKGKGATVKELKKAAQKASGIWLATDLDREGEAIAWHLTEALGIPADNINRVVFNAITKREIEKAFQHPRLIFINKVNAQQARRILDRIVGYQVSPLLWKKVAGGLSAGRVQSVAVRLLVEREREIEAFIPEEYWRLSGYFTASLEEAESLAQKWRGWLEKAPIEGNRIKSNGRTIHEKNDWLSNHNSIAAELIKFEGKKFRPVEIGEALEIARLAGFKLDDRKEEKRPGSGSKVLRAITLKGHMEEAPDWHVKSIQTKRTKNRPQAPFITSTLQQAAANKLGFTTQATMRTAQALYEGVTIDKMGSVGLITYMRTDSTFLSPDAINMARDYIQKRLGDNYLPTKANYFASSNKTAQEAHEAIRPTDANLTPDSIRHSLTKQQYRLYKIIWERFIACQMKEAQWDYTTILISGIAEGKELLFRATGRVLIFDGCYRVAGVPNNSEEAGLPSLKEKQPLAAIQIDPSQNFTTPPPRYTEASLVKKLEAEGIGRPSTYAQIIQVIQNRKYTEKIKNRFHATDLGKVVTDKLVEAFPEILQVGYTRDMEQQLDDIEEKSADWVQMLRKFYTPFKEGLDAAYEGMGHAKAEIQPAPHTCPQCGSGTVYRFGRNGRFLSCSTYPDCKYAAPIDREGNPVLPEQSDIACPKCGNPMLMKKGRFGPFLSCVKYPVCDGIVNLDKKGFVSPPKVPPLLTDLKCPKCEAPLNIRRGARGPWLSCSKFPKCRGRQGWAVLDDETKNNLENTLEEHEKSNPQPVIKTLSGEPVGDDYKPKTQHIASNGTDVKTPDNNSSYENS